MALSNDILEQPNQVEQANPQQSSLPTFSQGGQAGPSQHSNGAQTEWHTWRNQIPKETEKGPPKVHKPSIFKSPPRRGRGTGRGRTRSRRAAKAGSSESSTSEPDPIPVPYRRIQDAQEQLIFRDEDHDREGLAGMIGVKKEEWDLGLRTPVYAPPSDWMRLRQLQVESEMARKHFWVEEIEGYGARRKEEVELGKRVHQDIMEVGWEAFNKRWRREELMGVPIPDEPVPRKKRKGEVELTCALALVGTGFGTDGLDGEGEYCEDPTTTMPAEFAFRNGDGVASRNENEATAGLTGLVSPDSMEPGQVKLDIVNLKLMEWVEGEGINGIASSTPPDLGEEDAMSMNEEEVCEEVVGPAELTSATEDGATVSQSEGTAESTISTESSSAGGDESGESEGGGIRFDPAKYWHFSIIPGLKKR
ncbi:hypothetical protein VF21_10466 [Pseudogymnoascus sp. 05NY08]|nr:hypothetical protein VF21_10466 [Pseudogymnoascus sp. 05NY08]